MNLDDIKKKADELKQNFQENVVPEIKDKTSIAKQKTKKAKDSVFSFVEEKVIKRNPEKQEETGNDREPDIIERYVNGEPVGVNAKADTEADSEDSEQNAPDKVSEEDVPSDAEKEAENVSSDADKSDDDAQPEAENSGEGEAKAEDGPAAERVFGEVVSENESLKDNFMNNVVPRVKGVSQSAGDILKKAGNKVKETAAEIAPKIKEKTSEIAPKVKEKTSEIAPKVKKTASEAGPKLKGAAVSVGSRLKETVQNIGPKVKNGVQETADKISFETYRAKEKAKNKTKDAVSQRIRRNLFPNEYDEHGKRITVPYSERNRGKKSEANAADDMGDAQKNIRNKISGSLNKNNAYCHAKTILAHKKLVMEHCIKAGIPLQGITHDLSKFSPAEFRYGIKFFSGDRSPNEGEREDHGYSNAWMHHKGRNKHHFEYWLDYNIEANKAIPVKMPLKYVIEMFCDRVAAGKVYKKEAYTDSSPLEYFEKGRARRNIHPETSDFLEKLLKMLAKKGEDYTFSYIKWYMKHHDDY